MPGDDHAWARGEIGVEPIGQGSRRRLGGADPNGREQSEESEAGAAEHDRTLSVNRRGATAAYAPTGRTKMGSEFAGWFEAARVRHAYVHPDPCGDCRPDRSDRRPGSRCGGLRRVLPRPARLQAALRRQMAWVRSLTPGKLTATWSAPVTTDTRPKPRSARPSPSPPATPTATVLRKR